MTTGSPVRTGAETVELFFRSMTDMDLEAVLSVLHPDIEIIEPDSLPYGGRHKGIGAFQRDLLAVMLAKADLAIETTRVLDAGEAIVGHISATLTSRATGEKLPVEFVEIYEVVDGRIRHVDVYPKDTKRLADFLEAA